MNYSLVLKELYADKKWTITGNSYDGITWSDESSKPSDTTLKSQYADAQAKEEAKKEIVQLKRKLAKTDYVALPDYDQDKTDVIAQRQQWRERIRELELA
jgi:hypothetical protein